MADFEVLIDLAACTRRVGLARSNRIRGSETIMFEYDDAWLKDADRFSLEPALSLTRGAFAPPAGFATFRVHRRLGSGYVGSAVDATCRTS
nr:hypothetical protein K4M19_00090 [Agrobacterium fabrum]